MAHHLGAVVGQAHGSSQSFGAPGVLPPAVEQLYTRDGLALLNHPTGRFAIALRAHDVVMARIRSGVPVRLYRSAADEQVAPANSDVALATLHRSGVDATIVDTGDTTLDGSVHLGCNAAGTAAAVQWFTALS